MKDNNLYIKHIHIEKLWGKYQVDWELDPKVNILVGANGSGKSTILNILEDVLIPIVNSFFSEIAKKIVFKEQKCYFEQNGNKITLTQLSAGEKQLLIILLTILLQDGQTCLILMDEPEISLDTEWQAIIF